MTQHKDNDIIEPKEEFKTLTEAEVNAALDTADPQNPINLEVTRLVKGYLGNFKRRCDSLGFIPPALIHAPPSCGIEAVAMRLMIAALNGTPKKSLH